MNNPWESSEGKTIWKSKSAYFTWLRGALRQLWSSYPLRQEWKKRQLREVTQEEREAKVFHPQTKKVAQCHYCSEWFAGSKLEVDHKIESNGCKTKEEAEQFLWHCGGQTGDYWVLACKPCHKIKSYSQLKGISFEEAAVIKRAIATEKEMSAKDLVELLTKHGLACNNAKARRESLIKLIQEGKL